MELPVHTMHTLFEQLGLDSSDEAIAAFISAHKPLPKGQHLHEAGFWNSSQAAFLKQSIEEDADWAEVVDSLDTQLRA